MLIVPWSRAYFVATVRVDVIFGPVAFARLAGLSVRVWGALGRFDLQTRTRIAVPAEVGGQNVRRASLYRPASTKEGRHLCKNLSSPATVQKARRQRFISRRNQHTQPWELKRR